MEINFVLALKLYRTKSSEVGRICRVIMKRLATNGK